jgi:hypothetical protein
MTLSNTNGGLELDLDLEDLDLLLDDLELDSNLIEIVLVDDLDLGLLVDFLHFVQSVIPVFFYLLSTLYLLFNLEVVVRRLDTGRRKHPQGGKEAPMKNLSVDPLHPHGLKEDRTLQSSLFSRDLEA